MLVHFQALGLGGFRFNSIPIDATKEQAQEMHAIILRLLSPKEIPPGMEQHYQGIGVSYTTAIDGTKALESQRQFEKDLDWSKLPYDLDHISSWIHQDHINKLEADRRRELAEKE